MRSNSVPTTSNDTILFLEICLFCEEDGKWLANGARQNLPKVELKLKQDGSIPFEDKIRNYVLQDKRKGENINFAKKEVHYHNALCRSRYQRMAENQNKKFIKNHLKQPVISLKNNIINDKEVCIVSDLNNLYRVHLT